MEFIYHERITRTFSFFVNEKPLFNRNEIVIGKLERGYGKQVGKSLSIRKRRFNGDFVAWAT